MVKPTKVAANSISPSLSLSHSLSLFLCVLSLSLPLSAPVSSSLVPEHNKQTHAFLFPPSCCFKVFPKQGECQKRKVSNCPFWGIFSEMRGEAGQFVTNKVRKDVSHQIQSHDIITIRVQHVLNTEARNFVVV